MIITERNKNFLIEQNRITLLDSRFYFNEEGKPVPSVTTILDAYPKPPSFYEWLKKNGENSDEIRDEAGRKGSNVHRLTELYDKGEEVSLLTPSGDINLSLAEWAMFERYADFSARFKPEILEIEQNLVGDRYAGTKDRTINFMSRRFTMDIKTGSAIYPHHWLQLAAYVALDIELGNPEPDDIAILWLNAKTKTDGKGDAVQGKGWQFVTTDKPWQYYYNIFQKVYDLWMEENGSMIPKQVSYQLSHIKK